MTRMYIISVLLSLPIGIMATPLPCITPCITQMWYQSLPIPCPPNSTTTVGANARSDCLCMAGFYGDLSDEDENCTTCDLNELCPFGSIRPRPCPAGFWCQSDRRIPIPGTYDSHGNFTICPAGYFCMNNGLFQCEQGTICLEGSSAPTACPLNLFCRNSTAGVCPDGFICVLGNLQPCPDGFLCIQGNTTECATGLRCENGNTSCDTGFYNQTNQCLQCNDGTVLSTNGSLLPCPAGFSCIRCNAVPCPRNTYCPPSSFRPIPCPNGSLCLPQSSLPPTQCDTGWAGTPPLCVVCPPPLSSQDNATRCGCQRGTVAQTTIGNTTQCVVPPSSTVFATVASLTLAPTAVINTATLSTLVDAVAARWCNDNPDCTATVISITDVNGVTRYCTPTGGCPGVDAGRRRRLLAADAAVDICISSQEQLPTAPRDTTPIAMVASFVMYVNQQVQAFLLDNPQGLKDAVVAQSAGGGGVVVVVIIVISAVAAVIIFIILVAITRSRTVVMRSAFQSSSLTDVRIEIPKVKDT